MVHPTSINIKTHFLMIYRKLSINVHLWVVNWAMSLSQFFVSTYWIVIARIIDIFVSFVVEKINMQRIVQPSM